MKVKVEVDCTPAEAREFMGLPDLRPMQTAMANQLEAQMTASLDRLSPDAVLQDWFGFNPRLRFETCSPISSRARQLRLKATRWIRPAHEILAPVMPIFRNLAVRQPVSGRYEPLRGYMTDLGFCLSEAI